MISLKEEELQVTNLHQLTFSLNHSRSVKKCEIVRQKRTRMSLCQNADFKKQARKWTNFRFKFRSALASGDVTRAPLFCRNGLFRNISPSQSGVKKHHRWKCSFQAPSPPIFFCVPSYCAVDLLSENDGREARVGTWRMIKISTWNTELLVVSNP